MEFNLRCLNVEKCAPLELSPVQPQSNSPESCEADAPRLTVETSTTSPTLTPRLDKQQSIYHIMNIVNATPHQESQSSVECHQTNHPSLPQTNVTDSCNDAPTHVTLCCLNVEKRTPLELSPIQSQLNSPVSGNVDGPKLTVETCNTAQADEPELTLEKCFMSPPLKLCSDTQQNEYDAINIVNSTSHKESQDGTDYYKFNHTNMVQAKVAEYCIESRSASYDIELPEAALASHQLVQTSMADDCTDDVLASPHPLLVGERQTTQRC